VPTAGPHVLAIDQGTTGTTCLVIAANGRIAGRAYREITQHYPQPGWVEHDPVEILDRTLDAAREAVATAGVMPAAIGITNQRETVVVWIGRSRGARPRDRVAGPADRASVLALAPHADVVAATTGLTLDPYFSATKLEWLLRTYGWADRARRGDVLVGTIDSWLIWNLTQGRVYATDPTNASRTSLYDIGAGVWSDAMCRLFEVPLDALAEVRPSSGDFGAVDASLVGGRPAARFPLPGSRAISRPRCSGTDAVRRAKGKTPMAPGVPAPPHGRASSGAGRGLLTTVACDARGGAAYALEASIFVAARRPVAPRRARYHRSGGRIRGVGAERRIDGRVVFVPALTGLGAPHWEPNARGAIFGLTRVRRGHISCGPRSKPWRTRRTRC